MKIEKLNKSDISKMSDLELHQLRNQFAQIYEKFWSEKSWPAMTKDTFITKYAYMVHEMDGRGILEKSAPIDVTLFRKSLSDIGNGVPEPEEPQEIKRSVRIIKADSPERIVYGIVAEPDEKDTQGDHQTAEDIEKASNWFMEKAQGIRVVTDENHDDDDFRANLLENYITRVDMSLEGEVIKKGTWIQALRLDQETWDKVESGELTGFSMAGTAKKIESE